MHRELIDNSPTICQCQVNIQMISKLKKLKVDTTQVSMSAE